MTQVTATKLATQPPNLTDGEVAYQLSTTEAEIIAVSFLNGIGSAPDMFGVHAQGRYINNAGVQQLAADGTPLIATKNSSCKKLDLGTGITTIQAMRDDALNHLINDGDGLYAEILVARALATPVT